jgi:hypothetical protein
MVYDLNSLQRHKNKRGPSAENRPSPGTELLSPFYFETNCVAELEQKKNKLQKGGGGSTRNKETRVLFLYCRISSTSLFALRVVQCSFPASNLCRTAHSLFLRRLKRTNLEQLVVMVCHVFARVVTWCGYYEHKSVIIQFADTFLCLSSTIIVSKLNVLSLLSEYCSIARWLLLPLLRTSRITYTVWKDDIEYFITANRQKLHTVLTRQTVLISSVLCKNN